MEIIRSAISQPQAGLTRVELPVARATLAKRRWRGLAKDGREFGFDLEHPLTDGAVFFESEMARYVVAQQPEPVLELRSAECRMRNEDAARIGWAIGNLHFQIEIADGVIRVADDPALRQLFAREGWKFTEREAVFHPITGGHSHGHAH